jgi:2-phospho-L-lactate guanylyltransferase
VIIPFKAGSHKSRLSGALSPAQRHQLSILMLKGVLAAVAGAGLTSSCCLVSSDSAALGLAREAGAKAIKEAQNRGVNSAVSLGMRVSGASQYLVLPADLPLLGAMDICRAMKLKSKPADVVISPSGHLDGTNLLFLSGDRRITLSYDDESFWKHLGDAARRGYTVAVYTGRGVVFDVDTLDDLSAMAKLPINSQAVVFARKALKRRASS